MTNDNREKLEKFLMVAYGASTKDELNKRIILKYRCFSQPDEKGGAICLEQK